MKFKDFTFLLILVFLITLLFCYGCEKKKVEKLNLKKSFEDYINERNVKLEQLFKEGSAALMAGNEDLKDKKAAEIAELFTEETILIIPKDKKTKGKKAIKNFWKNILDAKVVSVTFTREEVIVSGESVLFPQGVPLPEARELAYVIGNCKFITSKEGEEHNNSEYNWFEILLHQKICGRESRVFSLSEAE